MSALPPAKRSSQNRGIFSYDLHPSIDHTTLQAAKFSGGNPTQRHQPLRAVQPHGEDSVCLTDRAKDAKRLKRKNTELEEDLVAGTPRIRGKRGKGRKRARGSNNNDEPPSLRSEIMKEVSRIRTSLEEHNQRAAENRISIKDRMRRLDESIEHLIRMDAEAIDFLAKVTGARILPPLWYLLDMGRMEILRRLSLSSWEELAAGQDSDRLSRDIHERLKGVSNSPSLSTLRFLCSYRGPRMENTAVHTATPTEIRNVMTSIILDSYDRSSVEEAFRFVFGVAL
ncbi:hypothetical protein EDD16DRAFT_1699949 [Pisolithus croceorrhizus]|nr:hypothetical protein EDD16DRAFT_1699949 [Pisolithus croceorrhizus]